MTDVCIVAAKATTSAFELTSSVVKVGTHSGAFSEVVNWVRRRRFILLLGTVFSAHKTTAMSNKTTEMTAFISDDTNANRN